MTTLIILAGGQGTRLGMLAQPNKALVSVQQRPMYAHHIAAAVEAGIRDIIVVVDESKNRLMGQSIRQSIPNGVNLTFVTQRSPGPAGATSAGLQAAWSVSASHDDHCVVVMSDTLIDHDELVSLMNERGTWAGVATAPTYDRHWCWHADKTWYDGTVIDGSPVFIGIMAVTGQPWTNGGDMSPLLNTVKPEPVVVESWQDVGDLDALSRTKRKTFMARDHHSVHLTSGGWISKNRSRDEEQAMRALRRRSFVPANVGDLVEYWPAPSIAELWAYDVLPVAAWTRIAEEVRSTLDRLHANTGGLDPTKLAAQTQHMLIDKPIARQGEWGQGDVRKLTDAMQSIAPWLPNKNDIENITLIHGDPNFTNLLLDPSTMIMRMIDPRGRWGRITGSYGNRLYDIAKVRYSYRDHFVDVVHNRFYFDGDELMLPPIDEAKAQAFDEVLTAGIDTRVLDAIQASILLSAAPLHCERQSRALTALGLKRARTLA